MSKKRIMAIECKGCGKWVEPKVTQEESGGVIKVIRECPECHSIHVSIFGASAPSVTKQ